MKLKEKVDKLLKEQNLTKTWLANKVGMKLDGLRYSLNNHSLKFDEVFMMAEALQIPLSELFPEQKSIYRTSDANNLVSDSATLIYKHDRDKEENKKLKEQNSKLKEEILLLKDQLKDKAHIIELLSKR